MYVKKKEVPLLSSILTQWMGAAEEGALDVTLKEHQLANALLQRATEEPDCHEAEANNVPH